MKKAILAFGISIGIVTSVTSANAQDIDADGTPTLRSQCMLSDNCEYNPNQDNGGQSADPLADAMAETFIRLLMEQYQRQQQMKQQQQPLTEDGEPDFSTGDYGELVAPVRQLARVVNVPHDDVLNIRSGPGTIYPIIAEIPPNGRNVEIINCGAGWCVVNYDGNRGWASARYLTPQ